jgi:RND family efflux transporter MFP subunit
MNTHLNLGTEHERKLAETLKTLSLEFVSHDIRTPRPTLRRLALPVGLSALAAAIIGVILCQPTVARHIETMVTALPNPAGTAADAFSVSIEADVDQGGRKAEQPATRKPVPTTAHEITGSGVVVAPQMTTVFSKYEGRITHIAVEAGDRVEAGQVLVTIEDAGARFALYRAEAARAAAELMLAGRAIDLSQARASLDRTEILAVKDATSLQTLEETRTAAIRASNAVAQAEQDLARAELTIRIAEETIAELTVHAPFAGTVTRLDAHVGDTVLARVDSVRENQSLLTITDMTSMVIDADVAETNIASLEPGLRGEAVLDGFPGRPFAFTVLRLAPIASTEKGTITLRLSLTNPPAGIRPNMAARIRIPLVSQGDTIQ